MALAAGQAVSLAAAVAYLCYRSLPAFFVLLAPAALYPLHVRRVRKARRTQQLEQQFKEAIKLMSAALSAGYSAENAVLSCRKELEMMYGRGGMMTEEFAYMAGQLEMNRSVEALLLDFADRSGLEEAQNFARIFALAKRSGGKLVPVIRRTVQIMEDRIQVKEEIRTLTASRRFEQKIMNGMPVLMVLYIDTTSPGFFDGMYTTMAGRAVMTGCLAVYLLSCWLSGKILDIRIS